MPVNPRASLAFELGLAAHRKGDLQTALARFAEAHESAPDWHEAGLALAYTYERQGRLDEAFAVALACTRRSAPGLVGLRFLCELLENYGPPPSFSPTSEDLEAVLAIDGADLRLPARMALATLARRSPLRDALAIAKDKGFAAAAAWALSPAGAPLLANRVLCRALREGPVTDPAVELLLSEIRRALALNPIQLADADAAAFANTLADQCVLNEYVWFAAPDEIGQTDHPALRRLYPPRTPARTSSANFLDAVSRRVADQYEEHPYPPWTRVNLPVEGARLVSIRGLQSSTGRPQAPSAPNVLIAGCGTGQQVVRLAAGLGPGARILACDLSASSLAYAARKAAEYGFDGIEFRQADILTLGTLDERFNIVSCTGVLHHMQDPLRGWRTLTELLAPDGVQHIGLYSTRARASLDDVRRRFLPDDGLPIDERIRVFRRRVIEAHAFDWGASGIGWVDFFNLGGCRDLLFHAQETSYDIPQIADALDGLGLQFLDFAVPSSVERAFAAAFPDGAARQDLAAWDSFERAHPRTFERMYQFWCAKKSG